MISIVPFKKEHQNQIKLKACYNKEGIGIISSWADAVTVMNDGVPIAVFGGYQIVPKTMQVWGLVSDDVRKCPHSFHRAVLKLCARVENMHRLNRIQLSVRWGEFGNVRWAKALGFENEAVMKKYGADGSDYFLLARVAK